MLKIGIIGCGYWGEKILKNLLKIPKCKIIGVCDTSKEKIYNLTRKYKQINFYNSFNSILQTKPNAFIISSPPKSHYIIAKKSLNQNIHILIEKPMCLSSKNAKDLVNLSKKNKLTLMIDHPLIITNAINEIKKTINKKVIGNLRFYKSLRENCNIIKDDVNILWDLAPHDIAILDHIGYNDVKDVSIEDYQKSKNNIVNKCLVKIDFISNLKAEINLNWVSKIKKRKIIIQGTNGKIVWKTINGKDIVIIYTKTKLENNKQNRNIKIIEINETDEILFKIVKYFIRVIEKKTSNVLNGEHGIRNIKTIELIQEKLYK